MSQAIVSPLVNYFLANNLAKPYADIEGEQSKSVYLPFTAIGNNNPQVQKSLYFQPDNELDGPENIITGIEFVPQATQQQFYNGSNKFVTNPAGNSTAVKNGVLYISNLKRELIAQLPLSTLIRSNNLGKLTFTYFATQIWQNCYVEFTDITGLTPTDVGLEFRVYYIKNINYKP